jgi:hypothetical protein
MPYYGKGRGIFTGTVRKRAGIANYRIRQGYASGPCQEFINDLDEVHIHSHRAANNKMSILLICRVSLQELRYIPGITVRCSTDAGKIDTNR